MRKFLSVTFVLVFTLATASVPANSAVKLGDSCKSVGQKTTVNGSTLTCTKSGSKLVWSKSVNADSYDAAFAAAFLAEAQKKAAKVLEDAETSASQISSPPNCTIGSSRAGVSIGGDPSTGVIALIYENPGICDLVVRASAEFYCPRGRSGNNTVISRATFALKARAKIYVSLSPERYFPLVVVECRQLTGYTSNTISVANDLTRRSNPTVNVESSRYPGVFNQAEATKKANQILNSAQSRAKQIIAEAKDPAIIAKAWRGRAAAEKAAADKIAAQKAAAEKAAAEKAAGVYLIDWRFNFNSNIGGFTSEQRPDGSVMVQCKDGFNGAPKWSFPIGLNLEGARLLLTGSLGPFDVYNSYTLRYSRVNSILVPVERLKVLGSKWGKDYEYNLDAYNLNDFVGKSIEFSTIESICGLTTEPLSDLKTTFASDIQTAALVLLIKPDQNPERIWPPGNQVAILIGSFKVLSAAEKVEADKVFAEKVALEEKVAADAKAASFVCIPGSNCPIGSTGPGGGIVFYDAGSQQSWGRYLEFAPSSWTVGMKNPSFIWCADGDGSISHLAGSITDVNLKASVGFEVGKGKANTDLMLAGCGSGAANTARAYRGGDKNDWYLPSKDELNELCKFAKYQATGKVDVRCSRGTSFRGGFASEYYWSSSEAEGRAAWIQTFVLGDTAVQSVRLKNEWIMVRPIRAF